MMCEWLWAAGCLGDERWDADMDLPGLVLVPGEISGVRTSVVIKMSHPQETEKPKIKRKKGHGWDLSEGQQTHEAEVYQIWGEEEKAGQEWG